VTSRLRLSANISMMFAELPFFDRIMAAAHAGFAAVECHFPYAQHRGELASRLSDAGMVMNGINTPAGDPQRGEFGFAAVPGREDDFRRGFLQALEWAEALGVSTIHCMCGVVDPAHRAAAVDTFLANMAYASDAASGRSVTLLVEPINRYDRPDWFVSRSDELVALIDLLGRENVRMMFDVYHIQIMEGDLLRRMDRHWDRIGHFQIASVPRRAEPDEGEVNYRAILAEVARRGWPGWVAAEYHPRGGTHEGLGWMKDLAP
jgi:hydroxypyruvate isomerase